MTPIDPGHAAMGCQNKVMGPSGLVRCYGRVDVVILGVGPDGHLPMPVCQRCYEALTKEQAQPAPRQQLTCGMSEQGRNWNGRDPIRWCVRPNGHSGACRSLQTERDQMRGLLVRMAPAQTREEWLEAKEMLESQKAVGPLSAEVQLILDVLDVLLETET